MNKQKFIEIIKGILLIGAYLIAPTLILMSFLFLTKIGLLPNNEPLKYLYVYIILFLILIILYRKTMINDFKDFKKNYKKYLKENFKYYLIGVAIMIVSTISYNIIGIQQAPNETANQDLISQMPITQSFLSILIIPVIEEIVFRRSFSKGIDNKYIFAIISGTIFGSLHVVFTLTSPIDLLYLIPYSSCGIALAYIYKNTDNIYSSILIHSLHNLICLLLLI